MRNEDIEERKPVVSIIVPTYKSDYAKVLKTIDSVLAQQGICFELIISEDSADNKFYEDLENFLIKRGFYTYRFVYNNYNEGTVKNIEKAIQYSTGKYIKGIGPGDTFYDRHSLQIMCNYMEKMQACFGFGKIQCFSSDNEITTFLNKSIPKTYYPYIKQNKKKIIDRFLVYEDWIFGVAQIYERESLLNYLNILIQGGVKYSEDASALMMILDDKKYVYVPYYTMMYEFGTGVSTNGNPDSKKRIANDQINFCDILLERYGYLKSIVKRRKKRIQVVLSKRRTFWRLCYEFILMPRYGIYKIYENFEK